LSASTVGAKAARRPAPGDAPFGLFERFPVFDGVRGVSILWVLLHHLPIPLTGWLGWIAVRGDLGVELFFAVSGFLVTRSLYQCIWQAPGRDAAPTSGIVRDFLARRVSRIFPPYYATLALLALLAIFVDHSLYQKILSIRDIAWSLLVYLYNYARPLTSGTPPGSLNIMWSLAFEEQFYLTLLLLFALFRKRLPTVLAYLGGISIAWRVIQAILFPASLKDPVLQFSLHLRFDAIAWGCLAWVYFEQLHAWCNRRIGLARWLPWLIVGLGSLVIYRHGMREGVLRAAVTYAGVSLSFTAGVVYLAVRPAGLVARFFAHRALVFVGVISYEIYLSHEVVIGVLVRFGVDNWPWIFTMLAAGLSIAVAAAGHILFSKPTQKWLRARLHTTRSGLESNASVPG